MTADIWNQLICKGRLICALNAVPLSSAAADIKTWSLETQDFGWAPVDFDENRDILLSQNGDSDAYRKLIERYQQKVGKVLWRFTRDKSQHEELVQETFVQAYCSLHTYKARAPFENWLTCIATRVGYHYWKETQKHRHADIFEGDFQELSKKETDSLSPEQAAELVHKLLAQLPPRDRLVLTLRFVEDLDIEETARRTGWSQVLVKVQTHRAKQKLKALIEKADMEFDL